MGFDPSRWITAVFIVIATALVGASLLNGSNDPRAPIPGVPNDCPVTILGPDAFTPAEQTPSPPPASYQQVWYGNPDIWTLIHPTDPVWRRLPRNPDGTRSDKSFWWSANYTPQEPDQFVVRSRSLDQDGVTFEGSSPGGSGFNPFMTQSTHPSVTMVAVTVAPGCWELTGEYKGSQISYVVWVE